MRCVCVCLSLYKMIVKLKVMENQVQQVQMKVRKIFFLTRIDLSVSPYGTQSLLIRICLLLLSHGLCPYIAPSSVFAVIIVKNGCSQEETLVCSEGLTIGGGWVRLCWSGAIVWNVFTTMAAVLDLDEAMQTAVATPANIEELKPEQEVWVWQINHQGQRHCCLTANKLNVSARAKRNSA